LILAAGVGSRFGGFKQIDPIGRHGEISLDYEVHDAWRAGFGKIVFVIRPELEAPIREHFAGKLPADSERPHPYAMVGFPLRSTLSSHGTVSRGVCRIGPGDLLASVVEHTKIAAGPDGRMIDDQGDGLIRRGECTVRVLPTSEAWFGMTYPEDRPEVQASIRALADAGVYPDPLW